MNENAFEATTLETEALDTQLEETLNDCPATEEEVADFVNNTNDSDMIAKLITWGIATIFGLAVGYVVKHRKDLLIKWLTWRIKRAEKRQKKENKRIENLKADIEKYVPAVTENVEVKEEDLF